MRETYRGLFQQRAVGGQVEARILDGEMPQVRAQRWEQGIDVALLCVPGCYTADGERVPFIPRAG